MNTIKKKYSRIKVICECEFTINLEEPLSKYFLQNVYQKLQTKNFWDLSLQNLHVSPDSHFSSPKALLSNQMGPCYLFCCGSIVPSKPLSWFLIILFFWHMINFFLLHQTLNSTRRRTVSIFCSCMTMFPKQPTQSITQWVLKKQTNKYTSVSEGTHSEAVVTGSRDSTKQPGGLGSWGNPAKWRSLVSCKNTEICVGNTYLKTCFIILRCFPKWMQ